MYHNNCNNSKFALAKERCFFWFS